MDALLLDLYAWLACPVSSLCTFISCTNTYCCYLQDEQECRSWYVLRQKEFRDLLLLPFAAVPGMNNRSKPCTTPCELLINRAALHELEKVERSLSVIFPVHTEHRWDRSLAHAFRIPGSTAYLGSCGCSLRSYCDATPCVSIPWHRQLIGVG